MPSSFGLTGLTGIIFGVQTITHAYVGEQLVWQPVQPHQFSTTTWYGPIPRSEWEVLRTHTVVGSGLADIFASWLFNSTPIFTASHLRAIRIQKNGVEIGYWDHGGMKVAAQVWDSSGSINGHPLADGDVLTLEAYATASNTNLRTLSRHQFRVNAA